MVLCFALCHLPVGRVGRVRRVGHLIFKKEMPESFAHERCLDHLMRNSMRESSMPVALHSAILIPAQSSMQMVWLNPARSSQSKFQETIVPRVSRVPHVTPRHLQSAKHYEMGLCAPCRGAPAVVVSIQLSKIKLAHSSATFQVRKHTFKASVACNGREVLRGTPARAARHFGD